MPNKTQLKLVLFNILLSSEVASAAGATGPVGMEGLDGLLIQLTVYPCVAIGLLFLIFKATGKAWIFFLTPLIIMALGFLAPIDPASSSLDLPAFFSWPGVWFYWTHILAIAIVYFLFKKTEKAWIFFFAPIIGWMIQIASLVFLIAVQ